MRWLARRRLITCNALPGSLVGAENIAERIAESTVGRLLGEVGGAVVASGKGGHGPARGFPDMVMSVKSRRAILFLVTVVQRRVPRFLCWTFLWRDRRRSSRNDRARFPRMERSRRFDAPVGKTPREDFVRLQVAGRRSR